MPGLPPALGGIISKMEEFIKTNVMPNNKYWLKLSLYKTECY